MAAIINSSKNLQVTINILIFLVVHDYISSSLIKPVSLTCQEIVTTLETCNLARGKTVNSFVFNTKRD